jgi:hypothetical protein
MSQKDKRALNRLNISMIVIEATADENLLLEPNSLEKAMSTPNKIKWDKVINSILKSS